MNIQFKNFSINLNVQTMNGMTLFELVEIVIGMSYD